jgi:hypothetical protein
MNRRSFFGLGLTTPAVLLAQQGPPREERIEAMTPPPEPAIALNHLGFLPKSKKTVIYRYSGEGGPEGFTIRDIGGPAKPFRENRPLKRYTSPVVDCLVGDFTDLERDAMYQVSIAGELSVPFFIGRDVWRRTLPKAVGYYRYQRCGVGVPNVHSACHLDDARRRDDGRYVDVAGGWHDAGDLRKWMSTTLLNAVALMQLERNLGDEWDLAGTGLAPLREEVHCGIATASRCRTPTAWCGPIPLAA